MDMSDRFSFAIHFMRFQHVTSSIYKLQEETKLRPKKLCISSLLFFALVLVMFRLDRTHLLYFRMSVQILCIQTALNSRIQNAYVRAKFETGPLKTWTSHK